MSMSTNITNPGELDVVVGSRWNCSEQVEIHLKTNSREYAKCDTDLDRDKVVNFTISLCRSQNIRFLHFDEAAQLYHEIGHNRLVTVLHYILSGQDTVEECLRSVTSMNSAPYGSEGKRKYGSDESDEKENREKEAPPVDDEAPPIESSPTNNSSDEPHRAKRPRSQSPPPHADMSNGTLYEPDDPQPVRESDADGYAPPRTSTNEYEQPPSYEECPGAAQQACATARKEKPPAYHSEGGDHEDRDYHHQYKTVEPPEPTYADREIAERTSRPVGRPKRDSDYDQDHGHHDRRKRSSPLPYPPSPPLESPPQRLPPIDYGNQYGGHPSSYNDRSTVHIPPPHPEDVPARRHHEDMPPFNHKGVSPPHNEERRHRDVDPYPEAPTDDRYDPPTQQHHHESTIEESDPLFQPIQPICEPTVGGITPKSSMGPPHPGLRPGKVKLIRCTPSRRRRRPDFGEPPPPEHRDYYVPPRSHLDRFTSRIREASYERHSPRDHRRYSHEESAIDRYDARVPQREEPYGRRRYEDESGAPRHGRRGEPSHDARDGYYEPQRRELPRYESGTVHDLYDRTRREIVVYESPYLGDGRYGDRRAVRRDVIDDDRGPFDSSSDYVGRRRLREDPYHSSSRPTAERYETAVHPDEGLEPRSRLHPYEAEPRRSPAGPSGPPPFGRAETSHLDVQHARIDRNEAGPRLVDNDRRSSDLGHDRRGNYDRYSNESDQHQGVHTHSSGRTHPDGHTLPPLSPNMSLRTENLLLESPYVQAAPPIQLQGRSSDDRR